MKKTYLQFANTRTTNLPKIISRRMRQGHSGTFRTAAYKSDGDDDEAEKLEKRLKSLESALEGKMNKAAKDIVIAELKSVNEALETLKANAGKADPKVAELEATIKALKEAADKNQPVIDAFVKSPDKAATQKDTTFNHQLKEGLTENYESIRKIKKGETVGFDMKVVADMSFANNFSTADVSVSTLRPGIIELPKRKLHVRELLSGGAMSNSNFVYVKEITGEEGPEIVAEGGAKNQFDLDLQEVSVPARKIAGYVRISDEMLNDPLGMATFLQSRLMELLLRAEDEQLLNGNGTAPNISGITDTGNFTAPTGSATIDVEQLVQAIAQLEGYDREANGILLNPADWYNIWLTKSTGSVAGLYNLPSEMISRVGDQMFIAGVPVFRSTAIAVDKFIVGDWVMGANLITRLAPRVEFFFEDGTNVRENKVTVRVEERIAFPIYGDNYFIYGDFGNAS